MQTLGIKPTDLLELDFASAIAGGNRDNGVGDDGSRRKRNSAYSNPNSFDSGANKGEVVGETGEIRYRLADEQAEIERAAERRNRTAEIVDEGPFSDEEREQTIIEESAKLGVKVRVAHSTDELDADAQEDIAKGKPIKGYYDTRTGEVEARNAASRLGMTLEERRASLASETEDVAREDQIFLRNAVDGAIAAEENNESLTKGKAFESGQPTQKGASLTNVSAKVDENFERTKRLNDIVSYIDEYGEMGGHEFLHEVVNAMTLEDSVSTDKSRYAKLEKSKGDCRRIKIVP